MPERNEIPNLPDLDILGKAGEGGMSVVWKARDLKRDRIVAVKMLNTDLLRNQSDISAFVDEEKAMEKIRHPGIVAGYELACHGGRWYFVMEFVDGYNFQSLLARKQHLRESDCLLICESLATALDYAWNEHGLVHCDIKPENIMINQQGEIKLTDLGLSHTFQFLRDGKKEVPDQVMGTPAYISPEQIYGDVELDCRADIYSTAATLYHLATGRVLFPQMDNDCMLRAHCSEDMQARDPRAYRPELSEGFCQLLEAMLVKNRDGRVGDWMDVFEMCRAVEAGTRFKPRKSAGNSSIRLKI